MPDILKVIESHYQGRAYGDYVLIVCPFHDDHSPSMLVYKNGYKCLACGAWGKNPEELLDKSSAAPQKSNLNLLPARVDQPYYEEYMDGCTQVFANFPFLTEYLNQRGIDNEHITEYGIGYKKGWYVFPIIELGEIVRLVFRASPQIQKETGWRYVSHGSPVLYKPSLSLLQDAGYVVVVFGILDAVSLCAHGIPAVTPSSGKGNINFEWFNHIRKRIYVVPDVGEEDDGVELVRKLGWRGKLVCLPPSGHKDPNDYVTAGHLPELLELIGVN